MDMFLRIDGIPGESTQKGHEHWIAVVSADFGVSENAAIASGSGASAGHVQLRPATFTAWTSSATPLLFDACVSGKVAATATFEAVRTGDTPAVLVRWDFEHLRVTSLVTTGAEESPTTLDTVTLHYTKLSVTVPNQGPRGGTPTPGQRPGFGGEPPLEGPA